MPNYDYQSDDRSFSRVLVDIGAKPDPKLYLGELVDAFGERGFGALMLFLGLISALIGIVPGTTTVLGTPILLIALQLVIRRDQLWLPRQALKSSLERASYRAAIQRALKPLRAVERVSRPRWFVMSNEVSEVLIGIICSLLAFILILPIWGGNLVPSVIIAAFGFGLMQRDGAVIAIAWAATAAVCIGLWLAWELVSRLLEPTWLWLTALF
ncbi:exopolysaccharide biosynthesis protein [Rhizobium sp. CRIBSB]|nr:exopolysaccharide biosynthesis protein [Rhizobium sp. CRIBSB]